MWSSIATSVEKPLLKCLKAQAKCVHALVPNIPDKVAGAHVQGDPAAAKTLKIDEVELMHRTPPLYAPYTGPSLLVETGEVAPNFSLLPVGSVERVTLSSLLATKPVFLEFVSVTWPLTKLTEPAIRRLRQKYSDSVHFVAIYILEVHPKEAPNPYSGEAFNPADPMAIVGQPKSFAARMEAAANFTKVFDGAYKGLFDVILVDELVDASGLLYNPVWSTYGSTPNGGWVIAQDGTIKLSQLFVSYVGAPGGPLQEGEAVLDEAIKACLADKLAA